MHATVLVVDNDERTQQLLRLHLQERCTVLTAGDPAQAQEVLSRPGIDFVVIHLHATDAGGLEAVQELCRVPIDVPIALVAGVGLELEAVQEPGHWRPVVVGRPMPLDDLSRLVEDAAVERSVAQAVGNRQAASEGATGIIAESVAMRRVIALIDRAAQSDAPVLLVGESGTGKELLARALHARSHRARGPFVAVNCSAIPETLLENELFGHRQGAFTDARKDHRGLFQTAEHGTIFLDEIGDMAPALQGKLLRVLQEKEVHPLGAATPVPIDVRVVTATHRDLDAQVAAGLFRQDLLYRINVVDIRVPPLRDRPEDLIPLLAHFLDKHSTRLARPRPTVSATVMERVRRHSWPGNVRELENAIERALVLGSGLAIQVDDLPEALKMPPLPSPGVRGRRLAAVEREHILRTLRAVDGNKSAAARVLGLNRKTLYRKLQHTGARS